MICKLFVFRHAETSDNARMIFSGWRDSGLTPKGLLQARKTAEQLRHEDIDYAFTSHLKRARKTLEIVLQYHKDIPVFIDDRLIERCYGLLQGKSKRRVAMERPEWYAKVHRGYDFPPPEGESFKMVLNRVVPFLKELKQWLLMNPGNVAISCHGNSMRPIRKVFENLSINEMCHIENPQDRAMTYTLDLDENVLGDIVLSSAKKSWKGIIVPRNVKLATDPRNPLKIYY